MRAQRVLRVGWLAVAAYAGLLVVVSVLAVARQDLDRSGREGSGAVAAFTAAWERSRTGTFVASGTFERRSAATGAVLATEDVVAQRPPARLHRQGGGVDGRVDDRVLVCPTPIEGDDAEPPCSLGPPGGPTYAADVATEVAGLRSLLAGPSPLYSVRATGDGCFALEQERVDPRAPFGRRARFCFDEGTGAPTARRVEFEGGVTEALVVTDLRAEVTDADLEP